MFRSAMSLHSRNVETISTNDEAETENAEKYGNLCRFLIRTFFAILENSKSTRRESWIFPTNSRPFS